ncbi:ATP-binding protein [Marinoscillum sp. MHG1-6]|uniref:ATP-binding protein n=1 Tax=Marinoscillum sp. MHG1-6 TaxID=2959627 RepID=UPI0021584BDA|nr:ATP-binding protein [Marinoscillum sp. MHG1-6]
MKRELTISCSKTNLLRIRQFVKDVLGDLDIHELEAHKMVLAVDEVCANLIIHSNQCDPSHQIDISIDHPDKEKIIFIIKDQGITFNYNSYVEPDLTDIVSSKRKGGVGLMLVKRIMDKVEFSHDKNCNICRLTKKIDS